MDKKLNQLPNWLWTNSTSLPTIYKTIWEAVKDNKPKIGIQTEVLVDTNKVFPLLLTSQLSTEILGHIWNLANQKYAGQLTEQELYIVLALVGAAQASYTFSSLDILHLFPVAPTPYLDMKYIMSQQSTLHSNSVLQITPSSNNNVIGSEFKHIPEAKVKIRSNSSGYIASEPSSNYFNGISQKSSKIENKAQLAMSTSSNAAAIIIDNKQNSYSQQQENKNISSTEVFDEFTEFQSAPIPSGLSVSNIPNTPSISSIPCNTNTQTTLSIPSIPMWDPKQGSAIGSRLANHNLGVKKPVDKSKKIGTNNKTVHINNLQPRVSITPLNNSYINKDNVKVECLSELFPKCAIKNQSKTVILKDTVIRSDEYLKENYETNLEVSNVVQEFNEQINNFPPVKTEFVKVQDNSSINKDLMNLQSEDKYSALRALVQEATIPLKDDASSTVDPSALIDDFGDFVSADQPNSTSLPSNTMDIKNQADDYTKKNMFHSTEMDNSIQDLKYVSKHSESLEKLKFESQTENRISKEDKFDSIMDSVKAFHKEDVFSINSNESIQNSSGILIRSSSVPSLDLKSFLVTNLEEEAESGHQILYSEWKPYMESCTLLLQVAANIFTGITSESVLREIINSAKGYNFLCNLAEVAAICRRVNFSYKEMDINIAGFDELLTDIDRLWAEMEPFYTNIPIVTELPSWPLHQEDSIYCALCLTVINSSRIFHNETNYHATCANLWLNCVNNQLPVLRHPSTMSSQGNLPETDIA